MGYGLLRQVVASVGTKILFWPQVHMLYDVLNRIEIEGEEHIQGMRSSFVIASNHTSYADVYLPGRLFGWRQYWDPRFRAFFAAATENFFDRGWKRFVFGYIGGCVPVDRTKDVDQPAVPLMVDLLRDPRYRTALTIFPEGTRSRSGRVRRLLPGVGRIVRATGVPVVVLVHRGLDKVLPVGSQRLRTGIRLRAILSEPLRFDELLDAPDEMPTWRAITSAIEAKMLELERRLDIEEGRPPPDPRRSRADVGSREGLGF